MAVTLKISRGTLTAFISGDIDHHTAAGIRTEIDHAVRTNPVERLILDFSKVSFMDSSGIGLVMGRYKLMTELGGKCLIADPPAYIGKVMRISGVDKLCGIISLQALHGSDEKEQCGESEQKTSENGGVLL